MKKRGINKWKYIQDKVIKTKSDKQKFPSTKQMIGAY